MLRNQVLPLVMALHHLFWFLALVKKKNGNFEENYERKKKERKGRKGRKEKKRRENRFRVFGWVGLKVEEECIFALSHLR